MEPRACVVPGCNRPAARAGRCWADYSYRRRSGRNRDVEEREAARLASNIRALDRELEESFVREIYRAEQHRLDRAGL